MLSWRGEDPCGVVASQHYTREPGREGKGRSSREEFQRCSCGLKKGKKQRRSVFEKTYQLSELRLATRL